MKTEFTTYIITLHAIILLISILRGYRGKSVLPVAFSLYSILYTVFAAALWKVLYFIANNSAIPYEEFLGTVVSAGATFCTIIAFAYLLKALYGKVPPQESSEVEK